MSSGQSGHRQKLALLLLAALVLRAGVLWKFDGPLGEDRDNYRSIARRVVEGDGFVDPQSGSPTAYRPPLYPLLVASILLCGGGNAAIGAVQAVLGVATVALTVLCGRRLGLGQGSMLAGALVAFDPLLLSQTGLVMTETLAAFLATMTLWLCLLKPGSLPDFALGASFGLCCLCRPTFWAFGFLAFSIWALRRINTTESPPCPHAGLRRQALAVGAGLILTVAPWGIRNASVFGRPVLTTTHGGYTLLLAHNPEYTQAVVDRPWGAVWEGEPVKKWGASLEEAMARLTPPIDITHLSPQVELARDQWMNHRAQEYIRDQPVTALRSGFTLVGRFWNVVPLATEGRSLPFSLRLSIGVFYSAVLLAVAVGILHGLREEPGRWWPLVAMIAAFTAVHVVYWADMRMRSPLVPAISILAVAGTAKLRTRSIRLWLWPGLKWAMFVAVVAFVTRHGYELWNRLEVHATAVNWAWLALAVPVSVAAWLPSAWYWRRLLSTLGPLPPWPQVLRAYYCGHLGKYLPGKAAVIVIRAALLKESGVSASSAAVTVTIESATYMWAGALLAILLFPSIEAHWPDLPAWGLVTPWLRAGLVVMILAAGIAGLVVIVRSYERIEALLRGSGKAASRNPGFLWTSVVGATVFLVAWWIQGLALGLTIKAVAPETISPGEWPFWTASAAVALVGGFIAVFTPGGLGVREGLLMELLTVPLGPRHAVVAAISFRAIALLGEILTAAALYWCIKATKNAEVSGR